MQTQVVWPRVRPLTHHTRLAQGSQEKQHCLWGVQPMPSQCDCRPPQQTGVTGPLPRGCRGPQRWRTLPRSLGGWHCGLGRDTHNLKSRLQGLMTPPSESWALSQTKEMGSKIAPEGKVRSGWTVDVTGVGTEWLHCRRHLLRIKATPGLCGGRGCRWAGGRLRRDLRPAASPFQAPGPYYTLHTWLPTCVPVPSGTRGRPPSQTGTLVGQLEAQA